MTAIGTYDKIIIGAGLYGLYAAYFSVKKGERVLVLEYDPSPFMRASYINQARLHNGYHYPRSFSTAASSIKYFQRFNEEFGFCVNSSFKKYYAVSRHYSWTNARQFEQFCHHAGIKCQTVPMDGIFMPGTCENMYETEEFTYDAHILKTYFIDFLNASGKATLLFNARLERIQEEGQAYHIEVNNMTCRAPYVLNTTYSSVNQVNELAGFPTMDIKYELCEVALCQVPDYLSDVGITVIDGPFFSLMPFGKTGLHSLTAVNYTPHFQSNNALPVFDCQSTPGTNCGPAQLNNCNPCPARPKSSWPYMVQMAKKFLLPDIELRYERSLFSVKSILKHSEVDDSRHTMVQVNHNTPKFVSVLSGKVNTIYDLEDIL